MVDFQSRNTSRGLSDEDDDEDEELAGAEPDEQEGSEGSEGDAPAEPETVDEHDHGFDADFLGVAVVTVSSTRSLDDDPSGDIIEAVIEADDHEVVTRELINDDFDGVQSTVTNLAGRADVDVVVLTGGTGVTPDDVTVEAVEPLLEKSLPGFGELFRSLSYEQVGTRTVATRATAGIVDSVPVFCLPGSEDAAHLGTEEIIVPEMGHLAGLARGEH